VREAIVNGVVHRDWQVPAPTVVEHVGDILTVTSPGGFIGGVSPSNIITHPAVPRYRSLADAMATLRLAEREGIGVDRMVRDMLAMGLPEPEISEVTGPYVRVGLIGGEPDRQFLALVAELAPAAAGADVNSLLVIDHLSRHGWIDVERAEPVLQRPHAEAAAAIAQLARAQVRGVRVVVPVGGVPEGKPAAWRLGGRVRELLRSRTKQIESPDGRRRVILQWARARGRVSTTEAADIVDITVPYAGTLLRKLEREGLLEPGRETKRGRGFYYTPAGKPGGTTPEGPGKQRPE
jgi:ATP-dependent DNA helicase RecG